MINETYYNDVNHIDLAFDNIIFHSPIAIFNDGDEAKVLDGMYEQELIPMVIIKDENNELFTNINKNKPKEVTKLNAVIIPIRFIENFQA